MKIYKILGKTASNSAIIVQQAWQCNFKHRTVPMLEKLQKNRCYFVYEVITSKEGRSYIWQEASYPRVKKNMLMTKYFCKISFINLEVRSLLLLLMTTATPLIPVHFHHHNLTVGHTWSSICCCRDCLALLHPRMICIP